MKNNYNFFSIKFNIKSERRKCTCSVQKKMRLDKFLKVSRIIKRRTVANEAADGGRISVNGRVVKPSYEVKVGDIVEIKFGDKISKFKIVAIPTVQGKNMPQMVEEVEQ